MLCPYCADGSVGSQMRYLGTKHWKELFQNRPKELQHVTEEHFLTVISDGAANAIDLAACYGRQQFTIRVYDLTYYDQLEATAVAGASIEELVTDMWRRQDTQTRRGIQLWSEDDYSFTWAKAEDIRKGLGNAATYLSEENQWIITSLRYLQKTKVYECHMKENDEQFHRRLGYLC